MKILTVKNISIQVDLSRKDENDVMGKIKNLMTQINEVIGKLDGSPAITGEYWNNGEPKIEFANLTE